jgi:hypothetical protein
MRLLRMTRTGRSRNVIDQYGHRNEGSRGASANDTYGCA